MNDEEWENLGQLVGKPVSEIKGVWMTAENWEAVKAELARLHGIIAGLPCLHTYTFEADECKHKPIRERCANCRAKAEAGV